MICRKGNINCEDDLYTFNITANEDISKENEIYVDQQGTT